MPKLGRIVHLVLHNPLLWGACATAGFYAAQMTGYLNEPHVERYLARHWASYICVAMFFIGFAAIVLKALDLVGQFDVLRLSLFDPPSPRGQAVAECPQLLSRLTKPSENVQNSCLLRRLRAGLEYVQRKGSVENLEIELRALSDLDATRRHASYGVVRMMIWAIPFVGSLGTVVGIGSAVANFAPNPTQDLLTGLMPGLEMVFDTTALALALSVLLMLGVFVCDQIDIRLLMAVDTRVSRELVGRFRGESTIKQAGMATPGNFAEMLSGALEKLVERQTEMLQASMEASNKQWEERAELLRQQLSGSAAGGGVSPMRMLPDNAGAIQESLFNFAAAQHHDLNLPNELLQELSAVIALGSVNWPVRKALRSKEQATEPGDDSNASWFRAA